MSRRLKEVQHSQDGWFFHFAQMMAAALQVTGCEISRLTALVSGKAGTGFNFTLRFKNGEVAPEGICFQ